MIQNILLLLVVIVIAVVFAKTNPGSDTNPLEQANTEISQNTQDEAEKEETEEQKDETRWTFRNENLLNQHYEKHGIDMGFSSAEEYEDAASAVVNNPSALHKTEAEDGDDVYYVESTNEFVIVSTDGYIRTYFNPDAGIDYYNRQ